MIKTAVPMHFIKNLFKNWLTVGMHKNVAVPMRLAKRHDLSKSQISMQIYQNHATRHDLVHSLYSLFYLVVIENNCFVLISHFSGIPSLKPR